MTLGPAISVCAGDGLSVAQYGIVFTWGRRDGQPCASAIDLATGSVEKTNSATLSPPIENNLEVSDPARGRVYIARNDAVIAFDCCENEIGTVFTLPSGKPAGSSFVTALRFDQHAGQLYVSYQDFDGQTWIASINLATGETLTDMPIPIGPWALVTDYDRVPPALTGSVEKALGEAAWLFFVDANTLVILDGATLELMFRISLSHRPASAVADPAGARLFVTDAGGDLYILDAKTMVELDRLPGVGVAVDLDPRLGRLYAGDRYSGGVNVFDLATLKPLGRIPQPGRPIASPADGRLYILEEDVYEADGATLQLITGRTIRHSGCEGCVYPTGAVVDPIHGQVYIATSSVAAGKSGPSDQATVDPLTGRAFIARTTGGYQPVYSLTLYPDLSLGEPVQWIDGLFGQLLYSPTTDHLYLAHGSRLLVLDGQTLEILGGVGVEKELGLLAVEDTTESLYAAQEELLVRFDFRDISLGAPRPEPVAQLPGPVYGIAVSPRFARDNTILVQATDWETGRSNAYRSQDGGRSWVRLGGGLPGPPNDLVFAPDGKLYAAAAAIGWRAAAVGATWSEGVYVSDDGGDTWRLDSPGLTHLRVERLHAARDGTLFALAVAATEPGHAASGPTVWTRPLGADWTPVTVPDGGALRLLDYGIPTTYTLAIRAYWHELTGGGQLYTSWGKELRRSDDGGRTWHLVGTGPVDYAEDLASRGESIYWVGPQALWRSTDEGATWSSLRHPALVDGPPFSMALADVDGAETLFLGTTKGQLLVVPVAMADWHEPHD